MSSADHRKPASPSFAALVQSFFAEHLTQQRALSPQTVAAYRDAFVLFLDFAQTRLHKTPTTLSLADLTPALILDSSSIIWNAIGTTLSAAAMRDWPRCARS